MDGARPESCILREWIKVYQEERHHRKQHVTWLQTSLWRIERQTSGCTRARTRVAIAGTFEFNIRIF